MSTCPANNYANLLNGVNLINGLTCSFTWLYLESVNELRFGDQSTLPDGESIDIIDIKINDGTTVVNVSGPLTIPMIADVSTLDKSLDWRIDYTVTTTPGVISCTVPLFIEPYVPEVITGTSDPNELPLPLTTLVPDIVTDHPVQVHEQSFVSLTTWAVTHNTGFPDPLSIEAYNAAGQRIMVGRSNILPNSFDIVFLSAQSGSVKVISKT